mmetsp:Transcript_10655/g.25273  ORF Transcript_10655/g.25273 Transcript_10655/m.25273 type:complete len:313 (+) Transcript_10655:689-1627(+)
MAVAGRAGEGRAGGAPRRRRLLRWPRPAGQAGAIGREGGRGTARLGGQSRRHEPPGGGSACRRGAVAALRLLCLRSRNCGLRHVCPPGVLNPKGEPLQRQGRLRGRRRLPRGATAAAPADAAARLELAMPPAVGRRPRVLAAASPRDGRGGRRPPGAPARVGGRCVLPERAHGEAQRLRLRRARQVKCREPRLNGRAAAGGSRLSEDADPKPPRDRAGGDHGRGGCGDLTGPFLEAPHGQLPAQLRQSVRHAVHEKGDGAANRGTPQAVSGGQQAGPALHSFGSPSAHRDSWRQSPQAAFREPLLDSLCSGG